MLGLEVCVQIVRFVHEGIGGSVECLVGPIRRDVLAQGDAGRRFVGKVVCGAKYFATQSRFVFRY